VKVEQFPKIVFGNGSFERMMEYARAATGEIAGFATVEERGQDYYISEAYIMPQRASGGGVLINSDTVQDFMAWCNKNGRPDRPAKARLWWHSHAGFSCFRSSTDQGTVALLRQVMPYLICMVVNKKREYELSLYQQGVTISKMKAYREDPQALLRAEVEAEVEAMVSPWVMNYSSEHDTFQASRPTLVASDFLSYEEHSALSEMHEPESPMEKSIHAMTDEEYRLFCKRIGAEAFVDEDYAKEKAEEPAPKERIIIEEGIARPFIETGE
jgi:proteasome lid subunit RPN8/RPN11